MVNVYIDDVLVSTDNEIVYNRNRLESADFGAIKLVLEQETRFEPWTRVKINNEQYLIESDTPLELRDGLWEHKITLIENMGIFTTIFPVDRQFTSQPSKSIKEILQIYKKELEFYQGFYFDFDDNDSIYDVKMINKQYKGYNFAVIVYDLFRRINAIPRLTWQNGLWYLSYELYTERNNELTLNVDTRQSKVNDIDYATELVSKTHNVISEDDFGIWFPSKDGYVTPRSKSTMLQTSDLEFELDSDISVLYKAECHLNCRYRKIEEGLEVYADVDLLVDFTDGVRLKDDYDTLEISILANPVEYLGEGEKPSYKQNNIYYNVNKNVIEGLYWKKDGILFSSNVNAFENLIASYMDISAIHQLGDGNEYYIKESILPQKGELDVNNIEARFYYRPKRDIDFIVEKYNVGRLNKSAILNNQRDSSIELSRYIENASMIVDRIGNEINNVTQTFDTLAEAWQLGDYIVVNDEYWLITNIKYTIYETLVSCTADFTKNFSNIKRETGVTREPSAFVYTGNIIQSNYIFREYLIFYTGELEQGEESKLTSEDRRVIMNLLDFDNTYNKPLTNATFRRVGDSKYIDMPLYGAGGGNAIIIHGVFRDPRVAGYGLKKIKSAWYKNPVYYTDSNYEVNSGYLIYGDEVDFKADTDTYKYYPEVYLPSDRMILNDLPFDKDVNCNLAFTYELIIVSNDGNIVIPNGFSKYCNLVRYFEDTPNIELYSDTEPYTIFDTKVKGTITNGNITLTDDTLTVTDTLSNAIPYWAIAHNDEIIIAGNNSISIIKYMFAKHRKDYVDNAFDIKTVSIDISDLFSSNYTLHKVETISVSINISDEFSGEYELHTQELIFIDVNINDKFDINYEINTRELISRDISISDEFGITYEMSIQQIISRDISISDEFNASYSTTQYTIDWGVSDETYWNEQDAEGNAYTYSGASLPDVNNYTLGDALRLTDGTVPVTYDYYKVIKIL